MIKAIRYQFPALEDDDMIFLENAGGSLTPKCVIKAIRDYMKFGSVQLGAPYFHSRHNTTVVNEAHEFINRYMGGEKVGEVVLGSSTTQLITMLAECYSRLLEPGDEIIICETAHEANAVPWEKLKRFGMVIKTWSVDPETQQCSIDELKSLITDRTKLVAFPHVSNLLGEVVDVKAITEVVHQAGAKVVVDGVALAPHRVMEMRAWGVDWYVFSAYKVFGPHMAALFGRFEAFADLEGPNHFFLPNNAYKFELGGPNHEGCAGLLALSDYFMWINHPRQDTRNYIGYHDIVRAWDTLAALEFPLQDRLLEYLSTKPDVTVWGPKTGGPNRVPTISFTTTKNRPETICEATDRAWIGIRYGHMYAYRLCQKLGLDLEQGVVRVSASHYNTLTEIEKLIEVIDPLI
jgi:cysteine desulfurase family protein (TIGR01976 family)